MNKILRGLIVGILTATTLIAAGGRGGGGFSSPSPSRSFSSPSPSRSYSSPSYSSPSRSYSQPAPSRSGSFSSPSKSTPPSAMPSSAPKATQPTSLSWGASASRAQAQKNTAAAMAAYKQPPIPAPTKTVLTQTPVFKNSTTITIKTYNYDRGRYYSGWSRPVWSTGFRPYYGGYDSDFLTRMLMTNAMMDMYYHHRHERDMQLWYADVQRQAATNAQIAQQLALLNARTAQLQANNAVVNQSYVPDGVPMAAVMAPAAAEQALPDGGMSCLQVLGIIIGILAVILLIVFIYKLCKSEDNNNTPSGNYYL